MIVNSPLEKGGRRIAHYHKNKYNMSKKKSHYAKDLKPLARDLRNNSTLGEVILWDKVLKNKKLGFQFNRQFPMQLPTKKIIVDFICRKLKLIIEIDGYSHNT